MSAQDPTPPDTRADATPGTTSGPTPEATPGDARPDADLSHVHRMWEDDGASRHLGIELLDVGHDGTLGHARTRMRVTETMVNGHRTMHGGLIFTLADSTFALTCNAGGELTVAAGCDIDFVRAGSLGDVLVAEGVERARYGRNGITDVTITRESDGVLVATFRGRSRAIKPRT